MRVTADQQQGLVRAGIYGIIGYEWWRIPEWIRTPLGVNFHEFAVLILVPLFIFGLKRPRARVLGDGFALLLLVALHNLTWTLGIPSDGYLGWVLLAMLCFPSGQQASLRQAGWIVLAVTMLTSGVEKWTSPLWRDATALIHINASYLAHDWLPALPSLLLRALAVGTLLYEVGLGVFIWRPRGRKFFWWVGVSMHGVALLSYKLTTVSLSMLVFHLFLYDAGGEREIV